MTEKNLPYFVTRMNLAMHGMELHMAQSHQFLLELLRREQGAVADMNGLECANPIEVCNELHIAKECVAIALRIANEMRGWFKEHCPKPTKERNLARGLKTLDHFYRSFVWENPDQEHAVMEGEDGFLGMIDVQACALSVLKDNLGRDGRPHIRERLQEAVQTHHQEAMLEIYLDFLQTSEQAERVITLQRQWSALAIATFLDH